MCSFVRHSLAFVQVLPLVLVSFASSYVAGILNISLPITQASAANINTADGADMTPLMWAAYNKNSLVLQWLMERNADREEKDSDGNTAMHW